MTTWQVNWSTVLSLLEQFPPGRYFGIPRGGVIVAGLLLTSKAGVAIVNDPADADYIVDDIVDSGTTRDRYVKEYGKKFLCLFDKTIMADKLMWIQLPWEGEDKLTAKEDIVLRMLQSVGEDTKREGLGCRNV
jgi:hypothetical protein